MKQFTVTEIRQITEDGKFYKKNMVYARGKDGWYIYHLHHPTPLVDEFADHFPKKSRAGNIRLYRDYWRFVVRIDANLDNSGASGVELITLPYRVVA